MELVQSILTYSCTAGIAMLIKYFFDLSKKIAILEEKVGGLEYDNSKLDKIISDISEVKERLVRVESKLETN